MGTGSFSWVFSQFSLGAGNSSWGHAGTVTSGGLSRSAQAHPDFSMDTPHFLRRRDEVGSSEIIPKNPPKSNWGNLYSYLTFFLENSLTHHSSGIPYFKLLAWERNWNLTRILLEAPKIGSRSCPWSAAKLRHLAWGSKCFKSEIFHLSNSHLSHIWDPWSYHPPTEFWSS